MDSILEDKVQNESFYSLSPDHSSCGEDSFHSIEEYSLAESLASAFSDASKHFNIVHINAQSIPAHYSDMLVSFDCNNIHAILVSESWLKPCLHSNCYSLPGFVLIRNDRVGKGGGGVAIYLRANIPYKVIKSSAQPSPDNEIEHLLVEISIFHSSLLLGVFYSPSLLVNYFTSFENLLHQFVPSYEHTILMGDFNTCLLKSNTRSTKLKYIIEECNLHIIPLSATHHSPGCVPSLLDLAIVSSPELTTKYGQLRADAFSCHDLIFLSYRVRYRRLKPKVMMQRNFSRMNSDLLLEDTGNIDWSPVLNASDVSEQFRLFTIILTTLFDKHAPIKPVKMKHLPAPWLSDELRSLIHRKNKARARCRRNNTEENHNQYVKLRNRCNTMCRDAQRRHIHTSVENGDSAKIWRFLKTLGIGKQNQSTSVPDYDLNLLNKHFSCPPCTLSDSQKDQTLKSLSNFVTFNFPPFKFQPLTSFDVEKAVLSISSNAIGSDNISRKMILPILNIISPILAHIFNNSLNSCIYPDTWKDAKLIPLPKKSNPATYSDFRPIAILPFLSKVMEKTVLNQLNKYMEDNNLHNTSQSGFRPGHSTTTVLVKVTDDTRFAMDNGQLTVLSLIDFSNAFNTVDHDVLLSLLKTINISQTVVNWFQSYLDGRRQRVQVDNQFSDWSASTVGVPQGGVLSPLLFSIFINSVTKQLTSISHMYADDLQIYCHSTIENLFPAIFQINSDLATICEWSKNYGLAINPKKSQVIIIGGAKQIAKIDWQNIPQVIVDGVCIPYSKTVKNLGIHLDETLSWNHQVKAISKKVFRAWSSLKRLRNLLPIPTKVIIAESLILSILDYADACYVDLTNEQLDKLERLQNLCIRFIFGLRKYDHVSEYRTRLRWLPIRLRRNTHVLSLLYCVLFDPRAPTYLKERFEFQLNQYKHLRSTDNLSLRIPRQNKNFYHCSFTCHAIRLWNSLPLCIKKATSLLSFKTQLKKYYLNS